MIDVRIEKRLGADTKIDAVIRSDAGVTALFGRSGAGKTSIVNMLAGLLTPDSGRVAIGDRVLFDQASKIDVPPEQRRIGYVFQDSLLLPHLTVEKNLLFGWRLTRPESRRIQPDRIIKLLRLDGLLKRRIGALSGGERQRIAIGRALLTNPCMLLMDEPLANLDTAHRQEIMPFLESLPRQFDMPIVYVSHQMDEIIRLAETLVVISDGRTVAQGPLEDILSRLDLHPLTGRFDAGAVISCQVADHDPVDALTKLTFDGGELWVPARDYPVGHRLRVRIRARDVALSLTAPEQTSVLNVLHGAVTEIAGRDGAHSDVLLQVGSNRLWCGITSRSVRDLGLAPGTEVYAMIKSVAVDRHSVGPAID